MLLVIEYLRNATKYSEERMKKNTIFIDWGIWYLKVNIYWQVDGWYDKERMKKELNMRDGKNKILKKKSWWWYVYNYNRIMIIN